MRILQNLHHQSLIHNTAPSLNCLRLLDLSFGPLSKLMMMGICTVFAPLTTYAALPDPIQAALTRAQLSPADISIMITPIGDKNVSHLPAIVHVVDSANNPSTSRMADNKNVANQPIIISKQDIQQREQQLEAYTDDPYAHQSIESTPSILPINYGSLTTIDNASIANKSVLAPLVSYLPNTARTPASTMKLIPSFIALDILGADFTWYTRVYHTGLIVGDRLHGDLIIQGSGDPKMTHDRLQQLLYQVQQTGIRHIDGNIIIDSAIFSHISKDPAAFDNSPLRPYNASPDGFLVNFSNVAIKSKPLTNEQSQLTYTPKLAGYQMPTSITTRTAPCSVAKRSLSPQWQMNKLTFNATIPSRCGEHIFYIGYPDAKDFATRVVAAKWQALGNTLSGQVLAQETPYSYHTPSPFLPVKNVKLPQGLAALALSPLPIVSYPSLTLTQQIYDINHFSNNVMAEQVALSIGAYHNSDDAEIVNPVSSNATSLYQFGSPTSVSYPDALESINRWWQTNLSTPPPHMTNGSGLCRDCSVTAANLNELLTFAYARPSFGAYVNSLGVAGVTGTILHHSERLPNSAAIGRAWIKTGTLNNVTSMAGYVKSKSGQDYVVVGLINTKQALNPYIARPVLDAMLDWTAQQ